MNAGLLCVCLAVTEITGQVPAPLPPGQPILVPTPAVIVAPTPVPALTLADFARSFVPAPGKYEVLLLHPTKCCPVKVCFTLPCGCPKVHVSKRRLEFDYGKHEVNIRFPILGHGAKVSYD